MVWGSISSIGVGRLKLFLNISLHQHPGECLKPVTLDNFDVAEKCIFKTRFNTLSYGEFSK